MELSILEIGFHESLVGKPGRESEEVRRAISHLDGESWNYGNASLSSGRKRAEKKMDNEEQDIWEVGEEDNVGRMLRARREILPWERVVEDRALLQAPMDQPVCLECLGPLQTPVLCLT